MSNIIQAVKSNDVIKVIEILKLNPELIKSIGGDSTLLVLAVANNNIEMVKTLVSFGADINFVYGKGVLSQAIYDNNFEMIKELVALGAKPDDLSVCYALAHEGNVEMLEFLFANGVWNNIKSDGYQLLQIAARNNDINFLRALLDFGAPTSDSGLIDPPLNIAIKNNNIEIVRLLSNSHSVNICYLDMPALIWAAKDGKSEIVKILLNAGADVNASCNNQPALMWAYHRKHPEVAKILVDAGADLAINYARFRGGQEFIGFLEYIGADLNKVNALGNTMLITALEQRHLELVRALIVEDVDLNIQNNNGYSALMLAAEQGELDIVELLISAGANLNLQDQEGQSALMFAVDQAELDIVELLISAGANLDLKNQEGKTALILAAEQGDLEIVESLVRSGASCLTRDDEGQDVNYYVANLPAADYQQPQIMFLLDERFEYIKQITNFLYSHIVPRAEITPQFYVKLKQFYAVNKEDLAIAYAQHEQYQADGVSAERAIEKGYQAILDNHFSLIGVSKAGGGSKLNSDVMKVISSFFISTTNSSSFPINVVPEDNNQAVDDNIPLLEDIEEVLAYLDEIEEMEIVEEEAVDAAQEDVHNLEHAQWRQENEDEALPVKRLKVDFDLSLNDDVENDVNPLGDAHSDFI